MMNESLGWSKQIALFKSTPMEINAACWKEKVNDCRDRLICLDCSWKETVNEWRDRLICSD